MFFFRLVFLTATGGAGAAGGAGGGGAVFFARRAFVGSAMGIYPAARRCSEVRCMLRLLLWSA